MQDETQVKKSKSFLDSFSWQTFLFGFFVGLAIFALIAFVLTGTALVKERRMAGNLVGSTGATGTENQQPNQPVEKSSQGPKIINTVGTFFEVDRAICKEGKKPIIYMFSTSWCPHCSWSKPAFESAVKDYLKAGKIVAYNWDLETNDNSLTSAEEKEVPTKDLQVYREFNPNGSIPTFVFGCRYFRIGTGHERENDLAAEEKEFKEIIEKLLK